MIMTATHLQSNQSGMSLIEILVALLLFSLAVLGLIALQSRAAAFSADAEDRNRAALLANDIISDMWLQGTPSPSTVSDWKTKVGSPSKGGLAVPSGSEPIITTDTTTKVTTITIKWRAPNKAATDSINQYTTAVVLP